MSVEAPGTALLNLLGEQLSGLSGPPATEVGTAFYRRLPEAQRRGMKVSLNPDDGSISFKWWDDRLWHVVDAVARHDGLVTFSSKLMGWNAYRGQFFVAMDEELPAPFRAVLADFFADYKEPQREEEKP